MTTPMKYEMIPTIRGMKRSWRLEMSLSVLSFLAQNRIIAIGNIEAKTSETSSSDMNLLKLKAPFSNDKTMQIIKNNGIVIIGGFVTVEIIFANFILFIIFNIIFA